ncbi:putative methyltransferase TARBP1 [Discoglossus pictus]
MELALAESLLSHCEDHATLIDELSSWDTLCGISPPTVKSLEVLHLVLGRLAARGDSQKRLTPAITRLALGRCLPLLTTLREDSSQRLAAGEVTRVVRIVCGVLSRCADIVGYEVALPACHAALSSLETYCPEWAMTRMERSAGPGLPVNKRILVKDTLVETSLPSLDIELRVEDIIEVLAAVVPTLVLLGCTIEVEHVVETAVVVLREGSDEAANLVCGRLLPCLGEHINVLKLIWMEIVENKVLANRSEICLSRKLLVLSTLSDQLFSKESPHLPCDSWCSIGFWRSVQDGLNSPDSLTRKRAVYLLKRSLDWCQESGQQMTCGTEGFGDGGEPALFFWSVEKNETLLQFWEHFILVVETLEGNQSLDLQVPSDFLPPPYSGVANSSFPLAVYPLLAQLGKHRVAPPT